MIQSIAKLGEEKRLCSPRMRGRSLKFTIRTREKKVLPAYAGMIRLRFRAEVAQAGAPRVCGDDPHEFQRRASES